MSGENLPRFVFRHRHLLRALLVAGATLFALAIPRLETRFAPEELVAPDDDAVRDREAMRRAFGPDEEVLLVVVEAPDVLAPDVLDWSHGVALAIGQIAGVARVESVGTTPFPRPVRDDALTLATLEAERSEVHERRARAEDAIAELVASDPRRFPRGLLSLAERGGGPFEMAPLISGERASAEERKAIEWWVRTSALVRGRLVSEDRRVLAIAAILAPGTTEQASAELVGAVRHTLSAFPRPAGVRTYLAGLPAMRVAMVRALRDDQVLLVTLATLGSFLVLVLGMRSLAGVLLPLGTVGLTLAISMGAMALAGESINLLTNMIPPLLVTIGLADAVHMVLRYRTELPHAGGDRTLAAARTLRAMWLPCFVTTFTTAIGFGALVLQETATLRRFGVVAACASMVSYVVTVILVPTSLPDFRSTQAEPFERARFALRGLDRAIATMARASAHRPWWTIGIAAVLLIASLLIGKEVVVDSALLDPFDRDSEIAQVTRLMERELDGVRTLSIGLVAGEGRFLSQQGVEEIEALARWLRRQPGVLRVRTHADWLREGWALVTGDPGARTEPLGPTTRIRALHALITSSGAGPLARYVTQDGSQARIEVRLADQGARQILSMAARFEAHVRAIPGLQVRFSGEAWDASRGLERIVSSLGSLASAIVLIFGVMTLLFRSLRLGLLSIPPHALPFAMTLAYMVIRGIPLHAATVIVFTVSVGLAVDGATHLMARFREELEQGGPIDAIVVRTMEGSGRGVVLSSLTLLVGYGTLLWSALEPVRLFGELSAIVIGGALVAQLVLLPALLAAFVRPRSEGGGAETRPARDSAAWGAEVG